MDDGTIVTVLGAGVSSGSGFPLARDLFPRVREFGESLGDSCHKLRLVIEHVVKKADELGCLTPDDLALQMYQRRFGGVKNYDAALNTLYYSRIATDALFLHIERQTSSQTMQPFVDFWHDVIGSYSEKWGAGFPPTKHRLVTFNYDRMPELVLSRHFPEIAGDSYHPKDLYGPNVLNAALSYYSGLEFREDNFCYLKLHGSIGIIPVGKNEIDADFGHRSIHYASLGGTSPEISDNLYFEDTLNETGLPKRKFTPLIAFPADKQRIEEGGQEYNLEDYIKAIRSKANDIFSKAESIRIVGYSFRAPDKKWLIELMRGAPKGAAIIVQNPHAKALCAKLEHFDGFKNVIPIEESW
jgi:hypothetical protein